MWGDKRLWKWMMRHYHRRDGEGYGDWTRWSRIERAWQHPLNLGEPVKSEGWVDAVKGTCGHVYMLNRRPREPPTLYQMNVETKLQIKVMEWPVGSKHKFHMLARENVMVLWALNFIQKDNVMHVFKDGRLVVSERLSIDPYEMCFGSNGLIVVHGYDAALGEMVVCWCIQESSVVWIQTFPQMNRVAVDGDEVVMMQHWEDGMWRHYKFRNGSMHYLNSGPLTMVGIRPQVHAFQGLCFVLLDSSKLMVVQDDDVVAFNFKGFTIRHLVGMECVMHAEMLYILYGFTQDGKVTLIALDNLQDWHIKWTWSTPARTPPTLWRIGVHTAILFLDSTLYSFNLITGHPYWNADVGSTAHVDVLQDKLILARGKNVWITRFK